MKKRNKNKIVLLAICLVCLILAVLISIGTVSNIDERLNPSPFIVPPSDDSILLGVIGILLSLALSVMSAAAAFSNRFYDKVMENGPASEEPQRGFVETDTPELDNRLQSGRIYISHQDRPVCWVIAIASSVVTYGLGYVCFTQFADESKGLHTLVSPIFIVIVIPVFIIFAMLSIVFFAGALSQTFFDKFLKNFVQKK